MNLLVSEKPVATKTENLDKKVIALLDDTFYSQSTACVGYILTLRMLDTNLALEKAKKLVSDLRYVYLSNIL